MKELGIFVDESGDFGAYDHHSPFYIITMVFHDQEINLSDSIQKFNREIKLLGFPENHCIHNGPIIRKEKPYEQLDIKERRRILNKMVSFTRQLDISFKTFHIEKKHITGTVEASGKLSKQISTFIQKNYESFLSYDKVKVYYDNGQIEVTRLLSSVLHALLPEVEFRKVFPSDYRLFQVADLLCTLELTRMKMDNKMLSRHELNFWGKESIFRKNYLKEISRKEYEYQLNTCAKERRKC